MNKLYIGLFAVITVGCSRSIDLGDAIKLEDGNTANDGYQWLYQGRRGDKHILMYFYDKNDGARHYEILEIPVTQLGIKVVPVIPDAVNDRDNGNWLKTINPESK